MSMVTRKQLQELTENYRLSIAAEDLQLLGGVWYITHAGLLRIACRRRCTGVRATLVQLSLLSVLPPRGSRVKENAADDGVGTRRRRDRDLHAAGNVPDQVCSIHGTCARRIRIGRGGWSVVGNAPRIPHFVCSCICDGNRLGSPLAVPIDHIDRYLVYLTVREVEIQRETSAAVPACSRAVACAVDGQCSFVRRACSPKPIRLTLERKCGRYRNALDILSARGKRIALASVYAAPRALCDGVYLYPTGARRGNRLGIHSQREILRSIGSHTIVRRNREGGGRT